MWVKKRSYLQTRVGTIALMSTYMCENDCTYFHIILGMIPPMCEPSISMIQPCEHMSVGIMVLMCARTSGHDHAYVCRYTSPHCMHVFVAMIALMCIYASAHDHANLSIYAWARSRLCVHIRVCMIGPHVRTCMSRQAITLTYARIHVYACTYE